MDRPLKQRLIGGAVLVALAVIFLPMLLRGSGGGGVFGGAPLPPKPAWVPAAPAPQPAPPAASRTPSAPVIVAAPSARTAPAPPAAGAATPPATPPVAAAVSPATAPAQTPKPSPSQPSPSQPSPSRPSSPAAAADLHAWVVQVASLSNEAAAMRLRDRMRAGGFAAFVERVRVDGKPVYRVRVGPEMKRAQAETLLGRVRREQKLRGIVLPYP